MSANHLASLMYETDLLVEVQSDTQSTLAILSMVYSLSRPWTPEQHQAYIPGPIPHGTLNNIFLSNAKYQQGSIAFVMNTVHGRVCKFAIIRTEFRISPKLPKVLKHHIRKTWADHTPKDLLKLVHQFAILEPLKPLHPSPKHRLP